jgi:hypothetical protein
MFVAMRAALFALMIVGAAGAAAAEGEGHLYCHGGQVWTECGKKCVATCEEPAPVCSTECQKKCECPAAKPIWNEKLKMCGVLQLCEAKICSHTTCHFEEKTDQMKTRHNGKEEHGISTRCMEREGACVCYCTPIKLHEEL